VKTLSLLGEVAHAYNPSYLGSGDQVSPGQKVHKISSQAMKVEHGGMHLSSQLLKRCVIGGSRFTLAQFKTLKK
jgi:hypothetical protein